jgi:hypothetical protein
MYGGTFKQAQRPTDNEFYCVMLTADTTALGHQLPGEVAPGKGSFDDMTRKAHGILRNKPYVTEVHINHRGNFWQCVTREARDHGTESGHGTESETVRDTSGRILRGLSLPCGCPLDSGCDSQHAPAW